MGIVLAAIALLTAQEPIDLSLASRYFQEAKTASDDDGGNLWGKPLYGPMIFVDRASRFVVANGPDRGGQLTQRGDVWVGHVPPELRVANAAMDWAGVHWTMVLAPVGGPLSIRRQMFMHEAWHRIQPDLGLPGVSVGNAHLDTKQGRTWLRLEWRALSRALVSWGPERKESLTDALTFRAYRRSLFPTAAAEEDRMEVHEGLAEYTGVSLMGLDDFGTRSYLAGRLKVNALKPSYTYAFAYETGPCYGLLLDMDSKDWRRHVTTKSSLSDMLRNAAHIVLPADISRAASQRARFYGGRDVMREEEKRERDQNARLAAYRKLLVDGPVLELPLRKSQYSFNPNELVPLGADGTVYPSIKVSDLWGRVEAEKGARLTSTFSELFLSAPTSSDRLSGDGWKLALNEGWKIVPGVRRGDFKVVQAGSG